MSDTLSVLNGASFSGAIEVREAGLRGMLTLRGDFTDSALRQAVEDTADAPFPDIRRTTVGAGAAGAAGQPVRLCWMSPDELLLLVDYAAATATQARLQQALAGQHAMVVDVSDARALFTLTGKGARAVLAKGAPVDLSPGAFGPGDLRRTRIGQQAAAFWMCDAETFELVCFRSVGAFMFDWLCNAAAKDTLPEIF